MKRKPELYHIRDLTRWNNHEQYLADPETGARGWRPSRPIAYYVLALRVRVELAWGVLTGKYDAVDWEYK